MPIFPYPEQFLAKQILEPLIKTVHVSGGKKHCSLTERVDQKCFLHVFVENLQMTFHFKTCFFQITLLFRRQATKI